MFKLLVIPICMLVVVPAHAKSKDVYPVSCDTLWTAVKDTLAAPHVYGIMSMNDEAQKASFFFIGDLDPFTDRIALTAKGASCEIKSTFLELGPDNLEWRQFHHRVARSLSKLQAAKPKSADSAGNL